MYNFAKLYRPASRKGKHRIPAGTGPVWMKAENMKKEGHILVVDDNKAVLAAVEMLLKPLFAKVTTLSCPDEIRNVLRREETDVVLLDMNFKAAINNGNEGLYWLGEIKAMEPETEVVLFTAYADIDLAVRGLQQGACDFVVKPFDNGKLVSVLERALRIRRSKGSPETAMPVSAEDSASLMFWGTSPAMQRIKSLVEKVAPTDANILITGPNGIGKEMMAKEIHRLSLRRDKPMLSVDVGALSESLFESELFGYMKGAFTDAKQDHEGKFELADHGTLFLDEIGNIPPHLQAKLLTVLQRKQVTRVGGNHPVPVDIRLVCATNCNLHERVASGHFREDLFYRINTIHIEIPPLCLRTEDIRQLASLFLDRYGKMYGKPDLNLGPDAVERLEHHTWPGNIRELEHAVERAVIMTDSRTLGAQDFELKEQKSDRSHLEDVKVDLVEMEKNVIQNAVARCEGNLSLAAAELGVSRQTLYRKMKKYGI